MKINVGVVVVAVAVSVLSCQKASHVRAAAVEVAYNGPLIAYYASKWITANFPVVNKDTGSKTNGRDLPSCVLYTYKKHRFRSTQFVGEITHGQSPINTIRISARTSYCTGVSLCDFSPDGRFDHFRTITNCIAKTIQ